MEMTEITLQQAIVYTPPAYQRSSKLRMTRRHAKPFILSESRHKSRKPHKGVAAFLDNGMLRSYGATSRN